ncbi:uncharacterized protein LOC109536235 [Dendroctonus ponderosae]|uniref:uncharacterized protein LOC109536235 n=1 Tax=Dendroctonus ponderosae TaxID=77166 RepID=UPI002035ADF6|nr:uncharacterized protein LOC109536235 [Dendroctonus ponderosae]
METSIDSIGKCSLDMEASRELPADWSEVGSTGTLCGSKVLAPQVERQQQQQHHLPSYLSLACTVNGYSTTTNYDPVRLARSRDASPHRIDHANHYLTEQPSAAYSVTNNLLSPPNLVPLPTPKTTIESTMSDEALRAHQPKDYYCYTKTVTFFSNESHHFSNSLDPSKDATDACVRQSSKLFAYSRTMDGNIDSTTISKEFTNGKETKSFIQQRVERLYGPGALAQGFFVSKRQKNRLSESEDANTQLNKTIPEKLSDEENLEPVMMRQEGNSNASLPVLRHLRPEFRAQLPLASPKKVADVQVLKSVTVPKLTDAAKVNGVATSRANCIDELPVIKQNGNVDSGAVKEDSSEKDGHYFLKILDEQSNRLLALADRVDDDIENPNLSEEIIGKLRSASGKAKLLVSQKIQQFKGLCTNNINQCAGEAFPTTNQDLQGFWDMVMLQVDQVDRIFEDIDTLRQNNWIEDTTTKEEVKTNGASSKPRKIVSKPKMNAAAEQARKMREEQRKKMMEDRRKAMKAQQSSQPSIKIFVPESS